MYHLLLRGTYGTDWVSLSRVRELGFHCPDLALIGAHIGLAGGTIVLRVASTVRAVQPQGAGPAAAVGGEGGNESYRDNFHTLLLSPEAAQEQCNQMRLCGRLGLGTSGHLLPAVRADYIARGGTNCSRHIAAIIVQKNRYVCL